MIIVDNENKLFSIFNFVIQFLISPYKSLVDVGCGTGQHTRNLFINHKKYYDVQAINDPPQPFTQADVTDSGVDIKADVITGLDFLEHLPKNKGYTFLIRALLASKLLILFCPEGEYLVENAVGPDQHQASWTAQEMDELGFNVWFCPNYHPTLGIGAFLAWRHTDGTNIPSDWLFSNF